MSISEDIMRGLIGLLGGGRGYSRQIVTVGEGGINRQIVPDLDYMVPNLTILNSDTVNTVLIGFQVASFPLAPGASITLRWKNPRNSILVYNDQGVSGIKINVIA